MEAMESCNNTDDHAQDCDEPSEEGEGDKLDSPVLDEEMKEAGDESPVDDAKDVENDVENNDVANVEVDESVTEKADDLSKPGESEAPPAAVPAKPPVQRRKKRGKRRRFSMGPKSSRSNNCHSPKAAKVPKLDASVVGDGEVNGTDGNVNMNHGSAKGNVNSEKKDEGKQLQRIRSSARIEAAHAKAVEEMRNKVVSPPPVPPVRKSIEKLPRQRVEAENKPQTIIVTETKSLAQVISNAVRKEGGSKEGKPTLVIIETKSPTELVSFPKSTSSSVLTSKVTNTITVETGGGIRKPGPSTTLTPVTVSSLSSLQPQQTGQLGRGVPSSTVLTSASSLAQQLTPAVIEDGGIAVEVPSLVVPYLIEYPPSRTISEFLKMLPLDPKEIQELEEASKKRSMLAAAAAAAAAAASPSNAANSGYYAGVGRPKTADRWGAYYESSLGKFFSEIGLNLAKEWVQTDLVRSQQRKAEKEGRSSRDRTIEILMKGLNDTKEKNKPFHFQLMKCVHCSFRTESIHVLNHHYDFPHERHLDFRCNFCTFQTRVVKDIIFHMEAEHGVRARVERPMCFFQCPLCDFEDNSKAKVTKHSFKCMKKFSYERNLAPPPEFDPPAKRPKVYPIIPPGMSMLPSTAATTKVGSTTITQITPSAKSRITIKPKDMKLSITSTHQDAYRTLGSLSNNVYYRSGGVVYSQNSSGRSNQMFLSNSQPVMLSSNSAASSSSTASQQYQSNQIYQVLNSSGQLMPVMSSNFGQLNNQRFTILPTATSNSPSLQGGPTPVALVPNIATAGGSSSRSMLVGGSARLQPPKPNISITPVTTTSAKTSLLQPRTRLPTPSASLAKLGVQNASSFVVCEICDGYIKDLEQLRTHMQWIHKVKIHPKMIFNRPPLNCQKCQFRFFTDQGLERHLLGAHGLVTSSMQENANKGQDSGRCTICGKVFQWKLLAHMSKDHNMILKPAHLSYKCTVCAATFGMYKLFETHVYQAHSTVAKRVLDAPDDKKGKPNTTVSPMGAKKVEVKAAPPSPMCSGKLFDDDDDLDDDDDDDTRVGDFKPCRVKLCRVDKCQKCLSQSGGKLPPLMTSAGDDDGEESFSDDNSVVSDAESVDGEKAGAAAVAACPKSKKPVMTTTAATVNAATSVTASAAATTTATTEKVKKENDEELEPDATETTTTTTAAATSNNAITTAGSSSSAAAEKSVDVEEVKVKQEKEGKANEEEELEEDVVEDGDSPMSEDEEQHFDNGNGDDDGDAAALDMEVDNVEHASPESVHTDDDDDVVEEAEEEEQVTEVY